MKKPLVVILAGGDGTHFSPLVTDKTVVPFLGKPLLQHTIETVEQNGFSHALIVTNSHNEKWLQTYQPFNITLQTHQQISKGGMAEALLEIAQEVGNEPFLVMNAVDVVNPSFLKMVYRETLEQSSFLTGLFTKEYQPAGYLQLEGDRIKGIIEKPLPEARPSDWINLVFHYFTFPNALFQALQSSPEGDDRYERALNSYMQSHAMRLLKYTQSWSKLKFPFHILDVMHSMLSYKIVSHQARSAYVSPLAHIEGMVYIDENAHVDAYAVIKGPAYIGRGAKIGNHTLVRQSTIEENAVVGFGSEVARSYIGPRCMLHHNFVGDSVLESDVNPSWGTTMANLRFDGKTVRMKLPDGTHIDSGKNKFGAIICKGAFLGVNCSLMPGVVIIQNGTHPPHSLLG